MRTLIALLLSLLTTAVIAAETPLFPPNVRGIYVFYQNPNSTGPGSGEEVGTLLTEDEFRKEFPTYVKTAKANNKKLIITAVTKDGRWVSEQIRYKGNRLSPAAYWNDGIAKRVTGVEVPLD